MEQKSGIRKNLNIKLNSMENWRINKKNSQIHKLYWISWNIHPKNIYLDGWAGEANVKITINKRISLPDMLMMWKLSLKGKDNFFQKGQAAKVSY